MAVLDTGIDLRHPALASRIVGGVNLVRPGLRPMDDNGHGTHVAGTIAARGRIWGVCPQSRLLAVKVLDASGSGWLSDVAEGLAWSARHRASVVNLSLGTPENRRFMRRAVQRAVRAGVLLVAAAGNDGPRTNTVLYPARYPEVVAVSALTRRSGIARFSSRGREVDLIAPGVDVRSTWRGGGTRVLSGTSMAAPHAAGVAAHGVRLLGLSGSRLRSRLLRTALRLRGLPRSAQGFGAPDAERLGGS